MSTDDSSDYAVWLALANDANQSEEARRHYREGSVNWMLAP
jgi:hypothetical protein